MAVIGLLGHEYDKCLNRLKVCIEDRGHTARIVNLQQLPRVTRATVDDERIVHDGYDLLGMDCFFLREMDVRDPFFHVRYSAELWEMLRERYLAFAEEEIDNLQYARNLLWMLAERKPVINHPRVYDLRNQMPYQLSLLARAGCAVPRFVAGAHDALSETFDGPGEDVPLRMDEYRTWEVYAFPKGKERSMVLRLGSPAGTVYRLLVVGGAVLEQAAAAAPGEDGERRVTPGELPAGVAETARRAAAALGASFAEVAVERTRDGETAVVRQVDPSPEFFMLEDSHRLSVSEPLAEHLIAVGSQRS